MMKAHTRILTMLVLCTLGTKAMAQGRTPEQAIQDRIESARSFVLPHDFEIEIESLAGKDPPTQEQLDKLERLAPSDPNSKLQLDTLRSQMKEGGARRRLTLYYGDNRRWRTSEDTLTYSISPYADSAHGPDGYWTLTQRQLMTARSLGSIPEDAHYNPEFQLDWFKTILSSWSTGIYWPKEWEIEVERVESHGDGATITIGTDSRRFVLHVTRPAGSASDDWSGFRVEQIEFRNPGSNELLATSTIDQWERCDQLGADLPRHQRTVYPDGRVESEYRVLHAGTLTVDIDQITDRPEPEGTDPIRGQVTFTSVRNHSVGETEMIEPETGEVLGVVKDAQRKPTRSRGWAVWLVAGGVVLLVVIVVVRVRGRA